METHKEWCEEMSRLNMDGIVFYPVFDNPYNTNRDFHCDYTLEEFKNTKGFPKSNWAYYKFENGTRNYYNSCGDLVKPPVVKNDIQFKIRSIDKDMIGRKIITAETVEDKIIIQLDLPIDASLEKEDVREALLRAYLSDMDAENKSKTLNEKLTKVGDVI